MYDAISQAAIGNAAKAAIMNTVKLSVALDMEKNTRKIQAMAAAAPSGGAKIPGMGAHVDMKV